MIGLTHTQKLSHEWKFTHTHVYCPSTLELSDVGHHLIAPLEIWVEKSPVETAQAQHLGHTTARWATFTGYIGRKLFMWEIICWAYTMDSNIILVMGLTHTQKLSNEWRFTHTHIYCTRTLELSDVGHHLITY